MKRLFSLLVILLLLPPASPATLLFPENNAPTTSPVVFLWIPDENAENQRLKVDDDPDFSTPIVDVTLGPTENSYCVSLEAGTYWWGVWTLRGENWVSENVWTFVVEPSWQQLEQVYASASAPVAVPPLLSPESGSNLNDNTPVLSWAILATVDNFQVQVDEDENFSSPIEVLTSSCSVELPSLQEGVYYWRVRAFRSGHASSWSTVFSFRIDVTPPLPPSPLQPSNEERFVDSVPLLVWQAPPENSLPLSFLVQIDNDPAFPHPMSVWTFEENLLPPPLGQDNYYWRVRARDNASNESDWSEVRSFEVLDTLPPTPPSPLFPLSFENTNDNTPLFRWGAPPENSIPLTYCVQVSQDRYEIFAFTWTDNEKWECPYELSDGIWYWRACARDRAGNTGYFFNWIPFTVDTVPPFPPPLLYPQTEADIDGTFVAFGWGEGSDDRTGIRGYIIQLSCDLTFTVLENECFLVGHEFSYVFPSLGEWYWRVGSVDGAGNIGWSETRSLTCRGWRVLDSQTAGVSTLAEWEFLDTLDGSVESLLGQWRGIETVFSQPQTSPEWIAVQTWDSWVWGAAGWRLGERVTVKLLLPIPVPLPLRPENSAHVSQVLLSWENRKAADNFEIQVDAPSKFWRPFRFTHLTWFSEENSFVLPLENLRDGSYLWRVRAWRSGACSPWSEIFTFVLDRQVVTPVPLLPDNGCNIGRNLVTFSWGEIEDMTPPVEYEVQVSSTPDFASYISSGWLSWRVWDVELGEGVYFWRVRARDNLGNVSEFSSPRTFRVDLTPPVAPRILSPSKGEWITSTSVTLSWEAVLDNSMPVTYIVLVDDTYNFSSPNLALQTPATSVTVTVTDGTWHWQVIAVDNANNRSLPSTAVFQVDATAPPMPVQVRPPATLLTYGKVVFEWTSVEDLNQVYYDLRIEGVLEKENLKENSFQVTLPPGRYVWRIRAKDGLGNTRGWSASVAFEIRDVKPPVFHLLEPLTKTVEENFLLRVRIIDDFGIDENKIVVRIDGQERGFTWKENLLLSEQNLPPGKHLVEVLVTDVGGNENLLTLELFTLSRVITEVTTEKGKRGILVSLYLKNRSEFHVNKRYALVAGGESKELEVSLRPGEETLIRVEIARAGADTLELIDLSTGVKTHVPLWPESKFPLLLFLPVMSGMALGIGILLRRKHVSTSLETPTEEEEKFPLPLPPPQKEYDDYSLLASLFRPEMQVPFIKEWSRMRKRYGTELSPLMEEYARLLKEGPSRLIERYGKLIRGRGS